MQLRNYCCRALISSIRLLVRTSNGSREDAQMDVEPRTGVRERTVEAIGYRIVDGTYPPGHRFANQGDLSAELGISRNVLREAIGSLREKGLVEARPKAGTMVADPSRWALLDPDVLRWCLASRSAPTILSHAAELRSIIEPSAARLAALRRTDEEAQEMLSLAEDLAASADDGPKGAEAELALRGAIFRAARNPILSQLAETVRGALERGRRMTVSASDSPRDAFGLYRRVAEAINAGDDTEASLAMADLTETAVDNHSGILELPDASRARR